MKHKYICTACGREYIAKEKNRNKYCSRNCSDHRKRPDIKKPSDCMKIYGQYLFDENGKYKYGTPLKTDLAECMYCGRLMSKSYNRKYCDECREKFKINQMHYIKNNNHRFQLHECRLCGTKFIPVYGTKKRSFCSRECMKRTEKVIENLRRRGLRKPTTEMIRIADESAKLHNLIRRAENESISLNT